MKKVISALIAAVLIVAICIGAYITGAFDSLRYSQDRADLKEYFHLENDNVVAMVLNNEIVEEQGLLHEGRCYFPLETIHKYFNDRFYVDRKEGLLLYALPDQVIREYLGQPCSEGYAPLLFDQENNPWLALDYVNKYSPFIYTLYTEPNRIVVTDRWEEQKTAVIKKNTQIRYQGGIKSNILKDVEKGEKVVILDEMENWTKVASADGFLGYVENKKLKDMDTEIPAVPALYTEPQVPSNVRDHKICMGWHQVISEAGNASLDSALNGVSGMNVISPTWFFLSDDNGGFQNIGSTAYVQTCHEKGLEVWGLVDDFTNDVSIGTILGSTTVRNGLTQNLVNAALELGLDGLNIDFEKVPSEAGEDYIQFIRELSILCRANNLVLSVDNYVPMHFNSFYHWGEQGVFADYVVIMGYDEHYAGSQEAGSVASIGYVENGIATMTEYVPAAKVINAVPLYARIWETAGGQVSSQAVDMNVAQEWVAKNGLTPVWDETTCQNYCEYTNGASLYQAWLEDEASMQARMGIMKKYGVGGVACWKLGYEAGHPEIWQVFSNFCAQ